MRLPKVDILINRANNTNRHNQALLLVLLTAVLVTATFAINIRMVFADPRILKQGTKQNANCNTVGTDSPLSDLCDQRSANDASNGVSKTDRNPETTGTLLVSKDCIRLSGGRCFNAFNVQITGNNPQPSSFSVSDTQSQTVILDPGSFTVSEVPVAGFIVSFSGNCAQIVPGSHEATGTISAGQHLTCVIRNVTP